MARTKYSENTNDAKDAEKLNCLHIATGNEKCYRHSRKLFASFF
jgi:hypothetical protein